MSKKNRLSKNAMSRPSGETHKSMGTDAILEYRNMDALESENWTLAYIPEQTTVYYFDSKSKEDLKARIALLDKADRMRFVPDVFRTDKAYIEAMEEAKAFYTEHYGESEGSDSL